ncbi:hypothetical protein DFA_00214 [Cavenderia fasciculata]|uniref:THH1/TOM1/TOM3 domain-containing protein n=1 Tax=Cavenderia fasciculata TaxID=261658 RepID=F4PXX6_CACFS|nr:uncharacterized protein DFA_00214 [Cavenderia fasciculata]EGG19636.1 hypothetical protein DFA_00214 [Cavenderia fasciculata]|eukprot:XP_004357930.1 hypothetical protein DFA_00214 [Cavenderia fasciculata]
MYSGLYYALGSIMCTIGILALILLVRAMFYPKSYAKKVFTATIVLAMFSRGVYFLLSPIIINGELDSFPLNAFLFWTYFMLFVSWADFYYQASVGRESNFFKSRAAVCLLTLFMFGSVVAIAIFFFISTSDDECKRVDLGTTFFIASLNLITAALFGIYGLKIYHLIDEYKVVLKRVHSWKIKAITWICSLCFLARSFMMVFSVVNLSDNPDTKAYSVDWYWLYQQQQQQQQQQQPFFHIYVNSLITYLEMNSSSASLEYIIDS